MSKRQIGLSIIELLLVLVIGMSILVLSVRQYQTFRSDADIQQLKYNVDTIFQAMAQYYKANCYGSVGANGILRPGTLNPASSPSKFYPIDIANDLRANHFLQTNYPESPLVNPEGGYVAQFNYYSQPRRVCKEQLNSGTAALSSNASVCSTSETIGIIVTWKPQVAVLLNDPELAQYYLGALGGDCLSAAGDDSTVLPCYAGVPGDYIVWERSSAFISATTNSGYENLNPTTVQFNQMYSTYPINYLMSSQGTIPPSGNSNNQQYFLCGD